MKINKDIKNRDNNNNNVKYCKVCGCNYHNDLYGRLEHETYIKCGHSCCDMQPKCFVCKDNDCTCIEH